jgi:uncharacterized membrane protein YphA (DoxX/SURF4 family)
MAVTQLLGLIALLQVKHLFADYFLQTPIMLTGRSTYLHRGRALHAGVHVAGTALALGVFAVPFNVIVGLIMAEWIVHFHVDWAKARWSEKHHQTPDQAGYWRANGTDQAVHQLTYVALAWACFVWTG